MKGVKAICFLCVLKVTVEECGGKLMYWIYKKRGGEDMVPLVFIRKNNNKETWEDNWDDREAKESGEVGGAVLDIDICAERVQCASFLYQS